MFGTLFPGSRFQNHPDLVTLQKYQSLSNQSFNHNSAHMPSLNTPKMSFEPRFRMFIINVYYTKGKGLYSSDSLFHSLFPDVAIFLGKNYCKTIFSTSLASAYKIVNSFVYSSEICFGNDILHINLFMHKVVKCPNILLKSCRVNTARFLNYVWPFYNIIHARVN